MKPEEVLESMGIPRDCIRRKSSCEENSRKFSIRPANGESVVRVKVDGCWLRRDQKQVDYLFHAETRGGQQLVLLVELKGGNYGKALDQVESMLELLCRSSPRNIAHQQALDRNLFHSSVRGGGVQAHIVLSTGKKASSRTSARGRRIPRYHRKIESLRQRFGVRVYPKTNHAVFSSVDALLKRSPR